MKTFYELGYMDIDEARQIAGEMNRHHFHYYDSGMVTYKKSIFICTNASERMFANGWVYM